MPNNLPFDKQVNVVSMLAEGASIRGIERMTGINRNTIMNLGSRVGQSCAAYMDARMRGLSCQRIEVDELWAFVGKKNAQLRPGDYQKGFGDAYTFVALDADTKLVPAFLVGKRDAITTQVFMQDLSERLTRRVQLSSDGFSAYENAVELAFGAEIDYGMIVKTYSGPVEEGPRKYSAPEVVSVTKLPMKGRPDEAKISTSYVEKQNHTVRMHCRRLSRLTNAYSKKLENFEAAVALHFAYYNLVKFHSTIRCTPAMAAGVERSPLTVKDLVFFSYQQ
jgi:IS1 family transposase